MLSSLTGPGAFRFALALLVFVNHTSRVDLGYSAVLIFFMLSGYWIFTMWTARYARARNPYLTFLVSRMWRLWPAFLLSSAIAWPLAIWNHEIPPGTSLLYQLVPSVFIIGYSLDWHPIGPAWSLDIEAQFYLIAPIVVALVARYRAGLVIASAACSLAAVLLSAEWSVAYYVVFFAIGMAAASAQWRPSRRLAWGALALAVTLILAWLASPLRGELADSDDYLALRAAEVVFALTMIPWTIHTASQRETKLDRSLGDLSYLFYILHEPLYRALNFETPTHLGRVLMKLGVLGIILVISSIVWLVLDRPSNRLRSKWVTGRIRLASDDPRAPIGNTMTQPPDSALEANPLGSS
jgi:peptidoglycan/LPS O-acetylase OafA/YrhL